MTHKADVTQILYPVFVHIYLDLIAGGHSGIGNLLFVVCVASHNAIMVPTAFNGLNVSFVGPIIWIYSEAYKKTTLQDNIIFSSNVLERPKSPIVFFVDNGLGYYITPLERVLLQWIETNLQQHVQY